MGSGASFQQHSVDNITATDCGIGVLTRLPRFEDDDGFGQAGISGPEIIRLARLKSDKAFRHWETNRPEGLTLCPSVPRSQV